MKYLIKKKIIFKLNELIIYLIIKKFKLVFYGFTYLQFSQNFINVLIIQ